jgi:hypothetical protein
MKKLPKPAFVCSWNGNVTPESSKYVSDGIALFVVDRCARLEFLAALRTLKRDPPDEKAEEEMDGWLERLSAACAESVLVNTQHRTVSMNGMPLVILSNGLYLDQRIHEMVETIVGEHHLEALDRPLSPVLFIRPAGDIAAVQMPVKVMDAL